MARKKKKAEPQAEQEPQAEVAVDYSIDDLEPVDAGDWRGQPNWACPYCDLTSLDKDRVRQHAKRAHRN